MLTLQKEFLIESFCASMEILYINIIIKPFSKSHHLECCIIPSPVLAFSFLAWRPVPRFALQTSPQLSCIPVMSPSNEAPPLQEISIYIKIKTVSKPLTKTCISTNELQLRTRMHSSRMPTSRFSGCLRGVCLHVSNAISAM